MFQEALCRINNIDPNQPWEEMVKHLNDYSHMLYLSGYTAKERIHNIKGALERAETIDREIEAGTRQSRFCTREAIRKSKIEKGDLTPATWFLSKDVSSTVSCQATAR